MQAEVCIHIKTIPHKSAASVELKKREINSQIEHIEEANADIPEDLYTSKEYADCMEQELKDDRSPFWKAISLFAYLIQVWMDWKRNVPG